MIQKTFTVRSKGLKGKADTPFVAMETSVGEKLVIHLDSEEDLANFEARDQYLIVIGGAIGKQQTLDKAIEKNVEEARAADD